MGERWALHDRYTVEARWLERASQGWLFVGRSDGGTYHSRERALLAAERLILRGNFDCLREPDQLALSAPVPLVPERRKALMDAFRAAPPGAAHSGALRELQFNLGEYALHLRVNHERAPRQLSTRFAHPHNPLRSLHARTCRLLALTTRPFDTLLTDQGALDVQGNLVRLGGATLEFTGGARVTGEPFREATVTVWRGFTRPPVQYRFVALDDAPQDTPTDAPGRHARAAR